jgi:hypothetical protein
MHGHKNQPFVIALVSHTLWIPKEISKILRVIRFGPHHYLPS